MGGRVCERLPAEGKSSVAWKRITTLRPVLETSALCFTFPKCRPHAITNYLAASYSTPTLIGHWSTSNALVTTNLSRFLTSPTSPCAKSITPCTYHGSNGDLINHLAVSDTAKKLRCPDVAIPTLLVTINSQRPSFGHNGYRGYSLVAKDRLLSGRLIRYPPTPLLSDVTDQRANPRQSNHLLSPASCTISD